MESQIRQLEWIDAALNGEYGWLIIATTMSPFGRYSIEKYASEVYRITFNGQVLLGSKHLARKDEAKAAAQADFETRIRSCLIPSPAGEAVETIDIDKVLFEQMRDAANRSSWVPPEYYVNDWVSDVCRFLETGEGVLTASPAKLGDDNPNAERIWTEFGRKNADLYAAAEAEMFRELEKLAPLSVSTPQGRYRIEHDGFVGTIIGHYTRLDDKRGVVMQQDGTNIVHVYGEKWLSAAPLSVSTPQEGWKPIETAERRPFNRILAYVNGDDNRPMIFVAHWANPDPEVMFRAFQKPGDYDEGKCEWISGSRIKQPTHWMPLPAAPSSDQGSE